MSTLYSVLGIMGAVMVAFILYRTIKSKPEQFSSENLNKSFATMGVLGLILIAFIAFLVLMLRQG